MSDDDFIEDRYLYTNIKKKIENEASLNNYIKILTTTFELCVCILMDYAACTAGDSHGIQHQTSSDFAKLPLDGKLNTQEIMLSKE